MAKQTVGIGTVANDGTGDTLRAGADKINDNFDEVYAALGDGTTLTDIINASGEIDVASGENKIVFLYSAEGDLPSATTYHGAIAHVHATGALYYAHSGEWHKLITDISDGPITNYTHPGPQLLYTTTGDTTSSYYRFSGPGVDTGNNPAFTVYRGHTYIFDNSTNYSSHPLEIRVSSGGAAFTEGVTQLTSNSGEIVKFVVPHEPSDTSLVYQCTVHSGMVGDITIV